MSLGPEKIILILVVALIVFGPQRLPEIARQVGAMVRELRRMQDSVRGELEQVLHPDFTAPDADGRTLDAGSNGDGGSADVTPSTVASIEETDHAALPPGSYGPDMSYSPPESTNGGTNGWANGHAGDYSTDDVTDDGFAGPRSFS
jgi:sec-independent protein translocase protein TatB